MSYKAAGFTSEGSFSPNPLIVGDKPVRSQGFTVKADKVYARGTLIYIKATQTEYEAYDGGTPIADRLFGILVDDIDTTGAAASCAAYIMGDFATSQVAVAAGGDLATVRELLAIQGIVLRDAVAA